MTTTRSRMLFVNLAVKDLKRSVDFFTKLGFAFNPQFTDETATCMIVSEQAFVMLLTEAKLLSFTTKQLCDTTKFTEGGYGLSCESREEVDRIVKIALENGASHAMPPQDHGFMYGWSFYDLDGHHWELIWMDPAAVQK
ncbi:VOC family protein [Polyangium sp. 6x1]|uniref:VOC family protein n=1 Tax=Polyangium sp. 6x1 TaxID=3042689 RepID=UPI00248259FD|nr:VOC family protein [Polyangium sp. 6x1]MDI1451345.1 VOC family protein [Polyangium sp. 6x1]